jgi:hypothetical protein
MDVPSERNGPIHGARVSFIFGQSLEVLLAAEALTRYDAMSSACQVSATQA